MNMTFSWYGKQKVQVGDYWERIPPGGRLAQRKKQTCFLSRGLNHDQRQEVMVYLFLGHKNILY